MVDVVRVLEGVFPAVIAARREQYATLSRPLASWQTTRLEGALDKLCDVESIFLVHVAVYKNLDVHLAEDLWVERTHVSWCD